MTDDPLDRLAREMTRVTPEADPAAKARALALAQKNFEARQGTGSDARPMSDRPRQGAGFWTGVRTMLSHFPTRAALVTSTGLVAVALVVAFPALRDMGPPPVVPLATDDRAAPPPAPVIAEETAAPLLAPEPAPAELYAEGEAAVKLSAPRMEIAVGAIPPEAVFVAPETDTEAFANADENPVKIAAEAPVSTFSADVDTASWAVLRSSILSGMMPPKDAVRIEEMVNYFPYDLAAPGDDTPFRPTVTLTQTPWNPDTRLLRIALQGRMPPVAERPPLNLVFLIDTSGSMQDADKLPLLKQSFRLMLSELRPEDQVAIVTYAGSAGEVLAPTPAGERATILAALDRLEAGGSTAGQEGLQQAYATAAKMQADGEVSRVLLATDGDFNVGLSDPAALEEFIADRRDEGVYLSVLGFGRGNLDDATMQALAQNGNGQAAYIDTLMEARKVLVDQLTGALFPIADDVKVQVEFNPAAVAEYRLIGYETRALNREDFNNDRVDAGEIGAGHAVTALYEVMPVGSPAVLNDPLRYGAADAPSGPADELAFLRLRYKAPGTDTSQLIEQPIPATVTEADTETRFAAAIAGFGQLLRGSDYVTGWGFGDAIALADGATGSDPFGYRREAVSLMRLADSLADAN